MLAPPPCSGGCGLRAVFLMLTFTTVYLVHATQKIQPDPREALRAKKQVLKAIKSHKKKGEGLQVPRPLARWERRSVPRKRSYLPGNRAENIRTLHTRRPR